jgi:isopenicillin-N N-acyltransferase-like protein
MKGPMLVVDLAGKHYDMGYQHGAKLVRYRQSLLGLIKEYREMINPFPQEEVQAILKDVRAVLKTHSPETLDMLRGIADGFTVSPEDLLGVRIRGYIEDRLAASPRAGWQDECTAWAVSNSKAAKERILIAKNRDYLISNRDLQAIFRCRPEKGYEYFSLNSIGACNAPSCGMNGEGLAIVDTRVPSTDVGPGIPRFTLMMHILEHFKSVEEVFTFLKSVPRMGGGNFVFGDARGGIGKAEIGFQNMEVLQKDSGYVVCTNHFEGPATKRTYRRKNNEREADSKWRFETVNQELSRTEDRVDVPFAQSLMALHGDPYAVCRHGSPGKPDGTATIASVLFVPEKRGFHYCQGFPCTALFHWISF